MQVYTNLVLALFVLGPTARIYYKKGLGEIHLFLYQMIDCVLDV